MTIMDVDVEFSDTQVITATADSTNILDLGTTNKGYGKPITVLCDVVAAFNTLTSLDIALVESATSGGTYNEVASVSVLLAALTAGARMPILAGLITKQFVKMTYTVVGTDPTLGSINAAITLDQQTNNI